MKLYKYFPLAIILVIFFFVFTLTSYSFTVHSIQIQGLQRISADTVRSYLPIHEKQEYTVKKGQQILQSLYQTGFFENVCLTRFSDVLVVTVKERPIISLIRFSGNKAINIKKLQPILNKLNILAGQPYDPVGLRRIEIWLEQQYGVIGYNAAIVSTRVTKEAHNRVMLYVHINEGNIVTVGSIQFLGNHDFSIKTLRQQFKLTTSNFFTWISHRDYYSQIKFEADLQSLSEFYLNHGYLHFHIVSKNKRWSPDKKKVYITIYLVEGPIYRLNGYTINGKIYKYRKKLCQLISLKSGDIFSRQVIINTSKVISDFLSDKGYAFVRVNLVPMVDNQRNLVYLIFNITSGKQFYVRRINFFGNQRTDQEVLRREMSQYEESLYSLSKIEESRRRLELLGYLSDIIFTLKSIPDLPYQIDLDCHVQEVATGRMSLQGGYSNAYGFLYGASISEPNFIGTGRYISIEFQNNQYQQNYSFIYNNPYYKIWGLQRGFSIYYSHIKSNKRFNLSSYIKDGYGSDITYTYPVSEWNSIGFSYGFEHIKISKVEPAIAAPSVLDFLGTTNGIQNTSRDYNQFKLVGSWLYNDLDRMILTTKGLYTGIALEIDVPMLKSSLGYYLATYSLKYYQPLRHGFILNLLATIGYGSGFNRNNRLPFFKNFYAGGIGSIPAFSPNSLGPKNRYNSFSAIGGNLKTIFGFHLIFPKFISEKVRTALVFDVGNVFQVPRFPGDIAAAHPQIIQDDRFFPKNLRPSIGFAVEWYTPLAPIDLTLAFPLDHRLGDNCQAFQFSLGLSL